MLTFLGDQVECLWDVVLPVEVRQLPDDLARLDRVLSDEMLLYPIALAWEDSARERGRPSIPMVTFVRLMVVKQRTGWGYETLVREVSDSLHLRRFCLIGIDQRVPDESTVRKLARRLGPEVVAEITRMVIEKAQRETRFAGRAARVDSTVVEADIRYPSDAMLALQGARALAREGRKLTKLIGGKARVRDRSRSIGKTVRAISKTLARRTGEAKAQVMTLNERAGKLIELSAKEAIRLAAAARASAKGRGAQTKLNAAQALERLADRCAKVAEQIDRRVRGLKITDRLVSLSDPDARPIRKGKLPRFNIRAPIWAYVYDSTVRYESDEHARIAVGDLLQPYVEPEIQLHFARTPPVTRDEEAILECIDWIAHGFEIVQCPFPDWKFETVDTIAASRRCSLRSRTRRASEQVKSSQRER
jgi:IS5 family transposase